MSRHHYKAWRWETYEPSLLPVTLQRDGDSEYATLVVAGCGGDSKFSVKRNDMAALKAMLDQVLEDWL